jgi:hypothetical protein
MTFDVAVWRVWPVAGVGDGNGFVSLPVVALVEAESAFGAVERVMYANSMRAAGHAAALALDRSIVYRAYGLRLGEAGGCAGGDQASLGA